MHSENAADARLTEQEFCRTMKMLLIAWFAELEDSSLFRHLDAVRISSRCARLLFLWIWKKESCKRNGLANQRVIMLILMGQNYTDNLKTI